MTGAARIRSCAYRGEVMHARGGTHANTFRYRHWFVSIDLDELPLLERRLRPFGLPLFGTTRRGLFRIAGSDWMRGGSSKSLREDIVDWVGGRLDEAVVAKHVDLVAMPRQLGHAFNPISVFYLTMADRHEPSWAVVEVHNTFGEPHRYLAPVGDAPSDHDKQLHVSPFLPMRASYSMRLPVPGERFLVRIDLHGAGIPFVATWTGRRTTLENRTLVRQLLRNPLGSRLVVARIHWQALKLWMLRRAPFHRKPPFEAGVGTIVPDGPVSDTPGPSRQEHAS